MVFLNDYNNINDFLKKEKSFLKSEIKIQENFKNIISKYIQNFASFTDNVELDAINFCLTFLEKLKESLSLCNDNIKYIHTILTSINDITKLLKEDDDLSATISSFNLENINIKQKILKNTIK